MTGLFLIIWFYLFAGMLFACLGLFEQHWVWQLLLWPVFSCIWLYNRIKESSFGWWVRYKVFKAKNKQ